MKLHLTHLPKLIAERRSTAVFGVVIIAMVWGGICLKYIQDIRSDEREAERTNQNFAMVFEENVLRSIGEIDKSLLYLRRTIETRQDTDDFHTIVSTADLLSEIIVQVAIIDAKGIMRASNAGPAAGACDRSERPRTLPCPPQQPRRSAVHQQAGRRPRQPAMVGPVHTALPQQRRQVRRGGRHIAQPGASDRLLQPDRFRILDVHCSHRTGRCGSFERRGQRRI